MGMTTNELEQFKQNILDSVRVMMQTTGQVTQYVGARYEPMFADPIDWSDQMEYEPLTIVTHQGNSFTSRQFVPKGIDINNADFWATTGNYNAQIEQYRQEVAAFDARIVKIENDIDAITAKPLMIVIGDSFSSPAQSGSPLWHEIVAKNLNMRVASYASDGQGFLTGNDNFSSQLNKAISEHANDDVRKVYIMGGLNDLPTKNTALNIGTECKRICNLARNAFTKAEIVVIGMLPFQNYNWYSTSTTIESNKAHSIDFYLAYNVASTSAQYISGLYYGLALNEFYGTANNSGQKHPSAKGEAAIAGLVLGHPISWTCSNTFDSKPTINGNNVKNINIRNNGNGDVQVALDFTSINVNEDLSIDLKTFPAPIGNIMVSDGDGNFAFAYGEDPHNKRVNKNILKNGENIFIRYTYRLY